MDVLSQAKYEDMTEEQKMLIDTIGADCFMDLVRVYGGSYGRADRAEHRLLV